MKLRTAFEDGEKLKETIPRLCYKERLKDKIRFNKPVLSPLERSEKDSTLQSRNSAEKDTVLPKRNSGSETRLAQLGRRNSARKKVYHTLIYIN